MQKARKEAIFSGIVTLVCATALAVVGLLVLSGLSAPIVTFLCRFFLTTTPVMAMITLVAILRIKATD